MADEALAPSPHEKNADRKVDASLTANRIISPFARDQIGRLDRLQGQTGLAIVMDRYMWLAIAALLLVAAIGVAVYFIAARHD
ncbi:hypothetical protein R1A27_32570 (plasmid) [Methylobacterium sp. NMS12]|uniref:hypothetical protein n=1 Tax=Methylobacterium sp. NMS12 TaxID=3079766 RepID=UPI003F8859DB